MKLWTASVLFLIVSASANFALLRRNNELTSKIESLRGQLQVPVDVPLPPLDGSDLKGEALRIDTKKVGMSTVLLVFSPSCSVCTRNWSRWDDLLKTQDTLGWRAVFVNVGNPLEPAYLRSHNLDRYTVLDNISKTTFLQYRFFYTPETILVDPTGRARHIWVGDLKPEFVREFARIISPLATP